MRIKKVRDFMNKKVITISPDDTIFEAARKLCKYKISGAPVIKDGKLVGVISVSDIVRFLDIKLSGLPKIQTPGLSAIILALFQMKKIHSNFKKELEKLKCFKVCEVMTKEVVTINPSASLIEAAELMDRYDVNRLPVVSKGKLVGIVARADLIKALVE